jgi:hypothetical protein
MNTLKHHLQSRIQFMDPPAIILIFIATPTIIKYFIINLVNHCTNCITNSRVSSGDHPRGALPLVHELFKLPSYNNKSVNVFTVANYKEILTGLVFDPVRTHVRAQHDNCWLNCILLLNCKLSKLTINITRFVSPDICATRE